MARQEKQKTRLKFSENQLIDYFNEHILYELLMLRYARGRLRSSTQILWNAAFSAFNVSARNLYEFLNNKGTTNEVKRHEYLKYSAAFRLSDITKMTGTLQLINEQVFHMGRKRPTSGDGKVNLERVDEVFAWVEHNMLSLVASFEDEFRSKIQMHRADPNYSDGMLHISQAEAEKIDTSSSSFELKGGTQAFLSSQAHTSHIQGVFVVPKKSG
jgi:hypothetical protein